MKSKHLWSISLAIVALFTAVATLVPSPALAQPTSQVEEYKELVGEGQRLFNDERWAEARTKFEKAYSIHPRPVLLFNIASTYRREGRKNEALKYYKKYLEVAPPDADYRGVAEEAVINVEEQIVADEAAAKRESETSITQPASSSGSGKVLRYSGLALGIAGLASLSFGIYQGLESRELHNKFENLAPETEWTPLLQDEFDRGKSLEQQAIIFSVVGGVAIAAGGALYVAGLLGDAPAERQVVVTPVATPSTTGLVLSGSF